MQQAKLNIRFTFFPYGGNGGISSEHPNIRAWFAKTINWCKNDDRIGVITSKDYSDTPITMTRNRAAKDAIKDDVDVLVMVDSDQQPDLYIGIENDAVPFIESSFNFLYERKMRGLSTTIGAPYCGPPPEECVYIFKWASSESNSPNIDHKLEMYSREHASILRGIQPAAALPTGCIMFDVDLFKLTDPQKEYDALYAKYRDRRIAQALTNPWFYYEYNSIYQCEKASTEDVTVSRDMALCAHARLGYNCLFANWDAWAGHWKPKCVGKPVILTSDSINKKYAEAVLSGRRADHKMGDIGVLNSGKTIVDVAGTTAPKYNINDSIAPAFLGSAEMQAANFIHEQMPVLLGSAKIPEDVKKLTKNTLEKLNAVDIPKSL